MFSQTCVIHSIHRGVYPIMHLSGVWYREGCGIEGGVFLGGCLFEEGCTPTP